MIKKIIPPILLLLCAFTASAKHIIGGEMFYEFMGNGTAANTRKFKITLKLFRDEHSPADAAPMPPNVYIGIFDQGTRFQYPGTGQYYDVSLSRQEKVSVNDLPECITNAPDLYYTVGYYTLTVDLPVNDKGYSAAYQTCCRISPLSNVNTFGGTGTGATYSCEIPAIEDQSPQFKTSIDAICGGKPFSLDFSATDKDADSLFYTFAEAYDGGAFRNASNGNPAPPPYAGVPYFNGFSGASPMGENAKIDSRTGIISGIAPPVGRYVVCVEVQSFKEGKLVNNHRKDFIINVTNCDFAGARLNPKPVSCDAFEVQFLNDDNSPLNKTFYWEFGDEQAGELNTSTSPNPVHVYKDTGVYNYKLVVNRGQQCSDSAVQTVKVYPGFFPDFDVDGKCIGTTISFTDKSTTNYGQVDSWRWKFNDLSVSADTSRERHPTFVFKNPGEYPVTLSVTSDKGCNKDFSKVVSIVEQPPLEITKDTLICNVDQLQLHAAGSGAIQWSPAYNISQTTGFNPVVTPKVPTTYYARLEESPGCVAYDSVFVDVVERVDLLPLRDTTICLTDTIQLKPVSNAQHYVWQPAGSYMSSYTDAHPLVSPVANTSYTLTASIGKCFATQQYNVRTVPYPAAKANDDISICFDESVQLSASGGSRYSWTPSLFLSNSGIANPVSKPRESLRYVVRVEDDLGCPKPAFDTVNISVEKIVANAGPRDTSVVINQPVQLTGTGGDFFTWSPARGLSDPNIHNPVATLAHDMEYVLRSYTEAGCEAFDTIQIRVFNLTPGLYVPTAFTPNGDGQNDIFRPVLIGMNSLHYFRIYERSGKLIYSTNVINEGWDGTYRGKPQDAAVFVWTVEGEDYQGKKVFEKGTVTLIR